MMHPSPPVLTTARVVPPHVLASIRLMPEGATGPTIGRRRRHYCCASNEQRRHSHHADSSPRAERRQGTENDNQCHERPSKPSKREADRILPRASHLASLRQGVHLNIGRTGTRAGSAQRRDRPVSPGLRAGPSQEPCKHLRASIARRGGVP